MASMDGIPDRRTQNPIEHAKGAFIHRGKNVIIKQILEPHSMGVVTATQSGIRKMIKRKPVCQTPPYIGGVEYQFYYQG